MAATIVASLAIADPALAQSAKCDSLRDQLQSASAPSRDYQRYDRAVKDQSQQLRKTQLVSARNGCGGLFAATSRCRRLRSAEGKMIDNLAKLKAQRNKYSSGNSGSKASVRAKMQRAGCFGSDTPARKGKNLLEKIFGKRSRDSEVPQEVYSEPSANHGGSNYRTLCVRSCDGYYFPISFSANRSRFSLDQKICNSMCPAAEVELYYHRSSSPSETAISYRTDRPYTALPAAFAYRKAIDPNCTCTSGVKNGGFISIAGNSGNSQMIEVAGKKGGFTPITKSEVSVTYGIGIPAKRIAPQIDPETRANDAGHLSVAVVRNMFTPSKPEVVAKRENPRADVDATAQTATVDAKKKKIRIVGPAFFPDQ